MIRYFKDINDPQAIRQRQLDRLRVVLADTELERDKIEASLNYLNTAIKRLESQLEPRT
jgi:uncharacterized coiled-coil protein SlyX